MVPNTTKPERELGLTIYRVAHGCSFPFVNEIFGISKPFVTKSFSHLVKELVVWLYSEHYMLQT